MRDAFEEKKNRERHLHNADEKRQMLYDFINSNFFIQFMLITVIVSTVGKQEMQMSSSMLIVHMHHLLKNIAYINFRNLYPYL